MNHNQIRAKRRRAQLQHRLDKMRAQMRRIHHYVATILKPDWSYRELLTLMCERMSNRQLEFMVDVWRDGEGRYAFEELTERKVLGKQRVTEDLDAIARHRVPRFFTYPKYEVADEVGRPYIRVQKT